MYLFSIEKHKNIRKWIIFKYSRVEQKGKRQGADSSIILVIEI